MCRGVFWAGHVEASVIGNSDSARSGGVLKLNVGTMGFMYVEPALFKSANNLLWFEVREFLAASAGD